MDDFCRCTPEEFEAICKAYHDQREADYKTEWDRIRWHASVTLQPHVKGKMSPKKLLPFPWEKQGKRKNRIEVSAEESKARFEKLAKRG